MCEFFSAIVTKRALDGCRVWWCEDVSHEEVIRRLRTRYPELKDDGRNFYRVEAVPDKDGWHYKVDEGTIPSWARSNAERAVIAIAEQVKSALDAYKAARKPALDAYAAARKSAWDAYAAARKPALDAYEAACKSALDAYAAARKSAWDAYAAACKPIPGYIGKEAKDGPSTG